MAAEPYRQVLPDLLSAALAGERTPLEAYLADHSNLPGPAGNFTLLHALADLLVDRTRAEAPVWALLGAWAETPVELAPANDPREFMPFAAALAHGMIGAALPEYWGPALERLRAQARDPRWRTREMVAQGLQAMARVRFDDLWYFLFDLVDGGEPLEMRAAAATVAEPDLLVDLAQARTALGLHAEILAKLVATPASERRSQAFRALRQGLGYTLSVVTAALPREGFTVMRAWAASPDADVRWLLRENLKKNRLIKAHGEETRALLAQLDGGASPGKLVEARGAGNERAPIDVHGGEIPALEGAQGLTGHGYQEEGQTI